MNIRVLVLFSAFAIVSIYCRKPGGEFITEIDDEILNVANSIVKSIAELRSNRLKNTNINLSLVNVLSANKQIVSGTKYIIAFRMRNINCSICSVETCKAEYLVVPWIDQKELLSHQCR